MRTERAFAKHILLVRGNLGEMNLCDALEASEDVCRDKVVLVGNPGVGKSTIFQRFKTGKFVRERELTHHDKEGQEYRKIWRLQDQEVSVSSVLKYYKPIP